MTKHSSCEFWTLLNYKTNNNNKNNADRQHRKQNKLKLIKSYKRATITEIFYINNPKFRFGIGSKQSM